MNIFGCKMLEFSLNSIDIAKQNYINSLKKLKKLKKDTKEYDIQLACVDICYNDFLKAVQSL